MSNLVQRLAAHMEGELESRIFYGTGEVSDINFYFESWGIDLRDGSNRTATLKKNAGHSDVLMLIRLSEEAIAYREDAIRCGMASELPPSEEIHLRIKAVLREAFEIARKNWRESRRALLVKDFEQLSSQANELLSCNKESQ